MKKLALILFAVLICGAWQQQGGLPMIGSTSPASGGGGGGASSFAFVAGSTTGCDLEQTLSVAACPYALHQTPGAGHLLVMFVTWSDPGTTTVSVTDPNNGSWTAIGSKVVATGSLAGFSSQNFMVLSAVSAPTTVTVQLSTVQVDLWWEATEYSYTGTLSGVDGTAVLSQVTASSGVATQSGLTTSGASDLIWASCNNVDTSCTGGAGFNVRDDTSACIHYNGTSCTSTGSLIGQVGLTVEDKVNVAAGAQTATFGTGTTDHAILGLVGF